MKITALQKEHYPKVAEIYEKGLATGVASFETKVPNWSEWNKKFLENCRFVLIADNDIIAWCALSPASKREVYKGVAESTIYVSPEYQGKGVGEELLKYLIDASEVDGFWTLQAGIFSENIASIRLHEKCGFRIIGTRERIAQREGVWKDNIILERRSNKIS